jgi:hypothetical protein
MLTPIANLLTAPTAESSLQALLSILQALGFPTSSWNKRGVLYGICVALTSLYASAIAAPITMWISAQFLPICPAALLPYVALYVYGVIANPATQASGLVSLTNPGGGTYNVGANQLVLANSFTGQVYTNEDAFTLGPSTTLTGVAIQAQVAGSIGNANPGPGVSSVDTVVSTQLFAGTQVTVVNPAPIQGLDADPPALIITKCQTAIAGRSYKGPNGAYKNAVVTAKNSTGNPVNVNRRIVSTDPTTGFITVYVASPTGAPTADDLNAVNLNVAQVAEPNGITATAVACTGVPLHASPTVVTIWATGAGVVAAEDIYLAVLAALEAWLPLYPISGLATPPSEQGYVFGTWLDGIVKGASPLIFQIVGFADVPLATGQVAELNSNTILVIRQVPTP